MMFVKRICTTFRRMLSCGRKLSQYQVRRAAAIGTMLLMDARVKRMEESEIERCKVDDVVDCCQII